MSTLSSWLDPTLLLLSAIGAGLAVDARETRRAPRRRRAGRRVAWVAWAALWAASTPLVTNAAARAFEWPETDPVAAVRDAPPDRVAIVVLGAGLKTDAPGVPLGEALNQSGAARVVGGARLFKAIGARWLIVSGGDDLVSGAGLEAALAAGVPRDQVVLEPWSRDTRENAILSAAITRAAGASTIVLVTSALHMRRSVRAFTRAGVAAVPAPVDYVSNRDHGLRNFFPTAAGLLKSHQLLHELLGLAAP